MPPGTSRVASSQRKRGGWIGEGLAQLGRRAGEWSLVSGAFLPGFGESRLSHAPGLPASEPHGWKAVGWASREAHDRVMSTLH